MEKYYLYNSKAKGKKYVLISEHLKPMRSFHFGASAYRDYTLMNSRKSKFYESDKNERERVKSNYQARHKHDNLDELSSGSLSMFLLWNKPTLSESIKDYERKFKINIVNRVK